MAIAGPRLPPSVAASRGFGPPSLAGLGYRARWAPLPPSCHALSNRDGECAAPIGSAELDRHHKIWYARCGGDHNMEEDGKIYKMLMIMTEVEAAALALLDTIDREREALRSALEGGKT